MTIGRTNGARIVFAVCFLGLMTVFGLSLVVTYVRRYLAANSPQKTVETKSPAVISFKELYPFADTTEEESFEAPRGTENTTHSFAYFDLFHRWRYLMERYYATWNPLTRPFLHLGCAIDKKIGNDVTQNRNSTFVRLPRGYLTWVFSDTDSRESWKNIQKFSNWLKTQGIHLLYLLPATKMDDSVTVFPISAPRGYSRMITQYKSFLSAEHISFIDAKEKLLAANGDFYSWFYKTDHHWNVLAGRFMAEVAANRLKDDFKLDINAEAVKEEHFTRSRYPALFYGSIAATAKAPPEDFEFFTLRRANRFHLEIPSLEMDHTGLFQETLIARSYLKNAYSYYCFLYGDQPLIRIENQDCTNGTRLLVVKHSQANVVCPYLACAVQFLDIIDPRHFDGSIKTFIEITKPDAVLICI